MQKLELKQIPIEYLQPGVYQPRREFDEKTLEELAQSIQSAGLIQPIVIRPIQENKFEIIAGERRWRAAQKAGLSVIDCLIKEYSDEQAAAVSMIENINRVDLNPIEEAKAYQRLIDEFYYHHDELAAIVGKSRTKVTNMLRLLKCDERVRSYLASGELSEGHGKILATLPEREQVMYASQSVAHRWSTRQLNYAIKKNTQNNVDKKKDPDIKSLESKISGYIGSSVTLLQKGKGCSLTIECQTLEIFQGVLERMGVELDD